MKIALTRAGGYDPRLGAAHPANHDPSLDPLDPRPMTADEVRDLVERVRASTTPARTRVGRAARDRAAQRRDATPASASELCARASIARVAARYAMFAGCPLDRATWDLGELTKTHVTHYSVLAAWRAVYPGVSSRVNRRGVR